MRHRDLTLLKRIFRHACTHSHPVCATAVVCVALFLFTGRLRSQNGATGAFA